MTHSREDVQHFIDTIQTEGRGLTKWEEDFIADMADKIKRCGFVSDREDSIIDRIYTERTP